MRLVLIFALLIGIVVGCGYAVLSMFDRGQQGLHDSPSKIDISPEEIVEEPAPAVVAPVSDPAALVLAERDRWVRGDETDFWGVEPLELEPFVFPESPPEPRAPRETKVLVFVNRRVPDPELAKQAGVSEDEISVFVDQASNAWIVRGTGEELVTYETIVRALDVEAELLDLDLVLVAVSEAKLQSLGVTAHFLEGASWLNSFNLGFETAGMVLNVGAFRIGLDGSHSDESVELVTMPTLRLVTGEAFQFSNTDEIPIASRTVTERSDVLTFDYRSVGLKFSGTTQNIGGRYFVDLLQSQGTVLDTSDNDPESPPRFREAIVQTSVILQKNAWAPVSGLVMERKQWRRGILSKRSENQRDLVLVFARLREFLVQPGRAVPVPAGEPLGPYADQWDRPRLDSPANPLLPRHPKSPFLNQEERALIHRARKRR